MKSVTESTSDEQMGHNGGVTQDQRSQSLPECNCDKDKGPSPSPPNSDWFKTWPENTTMQNNTQNKNNNSTTCDINEPPPPKPLNTINKLSLSEALQNISLAYSPLTKQLHLVDASPVETKVETKSENDTKGHKRNDPGSFSSTVSSLSDPSTSGSLLESDERSLASFDEDTVKKKGFTDFFNKNVFTWKPTPNVWSFFTKHAGKNETTGSPLHVISSTALIQHPRPSNLPAKTAEEETRHREEYKAMILAARRKEAQNNAARQKQQKQQLAQEEQQAHATKHFIKHVLSNWDAMRTNKKTRDLWWCGLPSCVRGKVWRLAIGNDLNLTGQLYDICLSRAEHRLSSGSNDKLDDPKTILEDQESSLDMIRLDISRTFPNLGIFQHGGPYSETLHRLLAAYVCYRPDVGYVQGMSYIAAILILNMESLDAFVCFANLLNQPLHLAAFTLNQQQMKAYYNAYEDIFSSNLPKLHRHFAEAGLTPDLYLLDWIYTIFAKAMPLDVACRVWDVFLRDGHEFIFRTAVGILHLNEHALIEMDFLHGAQFLTRLPDDLSADLLFKSIQSVSTSVGKMTFGQIVDKYMQVDEAR